MLAFETCGSAIALYVEYATSTSTRGIYFLQIFHGDDAVVATISEASFCQKQEQLDGITQNFKSQQACITALAPGNALNAEKMLIHLLSWSLTRIRRVSRSTLMAEAHALSNAVQHGLRTRATIVDMKGQLIFARWEGTASAAMEHNKRLAIDLSVLKQLIWDSRDDCDEEVDGSKGDYDRWIDTSAMLTDMGCQTPDRGQSDGVRCPNLLFVRSCALPPCLGQAQCLSGQE